MSALTEWRAYLNAWPSGEEAMDLRFEVLLRETINSGNMTRFIARRMAGDKTAQVPEMKEMHEVKLFRRLGQLFDEQGKRSKKGFTPEEVSSKRALFRHAVAKAKGNT